LKTFTAEKKLKSRGDIVQNILDAYKDAENLMIENFENIGFRNLSALRDNGIIIKESELGLKFEEITKSIFEKLGFNVDEKLKNKLNTAKDKIDILLNLENNEVIIIECKTVKESGYNKFSSVSRQIKSYVELAKGNGYTVVKSLLVAPDFSDDFINDCDLEFEINLSLITANSLVNILEGFRNSKHKQFPYQLLLKDVLIKEERILKAISK
jgi:RecB family endonuclease NucS